MPGVYWRTMNPRDFKKVLTRICNGDEHLCRDNPTPCPEEVSDFMPILNQCHPHGDHHFSRSCSVHLTSTHPSGGYPRFASIQFPNSLKSLKQRKLAKNCCLAAWHITAHRQGPKVSSTSHARNSDLCCLIRVDLELELTGPMRLIQPVKRGSR